jgi:hypothetical protein
MNKIFIAIGKANPIKADVKSKRAEIIKKNGLTHNGFGRYLDSAGNVFKFETGTAKLIDTGKKHKRLSKDTVKSAHSFLQSIKANLCTPKGKALGLDAALLGFTHTGFEGNHVHGFSGKASQGKSLLGKLKKDGHKIIKHTDGKFYVMKENGKPFASIAFNGKESKLKLV